MSNDGITPSNPALDAAMANATGDSITDIVQAMKDTLHSGQFAPVPVPAEASAPAAGHLFEKEIRFAPSSGRRTLVIRASSEQELRELEDSILYPYGK